MPILTLPWWVWSVVAVVVWLIGQAMIALGSRPAPPVLTPGAVVGEAISNSLMKILGQVLSLAALYLLVPAAVIAGIFQTAGGLISKSTSQKRLPEGAVLPTESGQSERDLYIEWRAGEQTEIRLDTSTWNLALLKALEWKRFEQLNGAYFRTLKFRVEEASPGPDGGVDLRLYVDEATASPILVQCKAWNTWKVGVKQIRELFGVMTAEGVSEGIYVTTSSFSKEASEFANGKNIHLIDGDDLLAKLRALPSDEQDQLRNLATSGDFSTPTCASCGVKMIQRVSTKTRERFWGCINYPRCRSTLKA
jgi:restriction system protein